MCVKDEEQMGERMENFAFFDTQIGNWGIDSTNSAYDRSRFGDDPTIGSPSPLESICENTAVINSQQNLSPNFVPIIRSGEWSYIGERQYMEDTHVCIADLAKKFGYTFLDGEVISFYGVFDGHGGKGAAQFVRDNLPRVIVEDADFPLELEKVVTRSFIQTDAKTCSLQSSLSSDLCW